MEAMASKIEILRLDIPALAKEIVERQVQLQPEFLTYGHKGMVHSLNDAKYNLEYLFSAVELDSKLLFEQYNAWVNRLFFNLKLPKDTLVKFYDCTKEVFKERMDKGNIDEALFNKLLDYMAFGIQVLKREETKPISYIEKDNPLITYLIEYSAFILSGDRNSANKLIMDIANSPISLKDIYKYILQPFQRELGVLWHENKISVAQEHYATAVSQFAMSLLYDKIFSTPKNGKIFLGTCVEGDLHELGIRMVCDYMESCGYDTHYLGANMPVRGIIQAIKEKKPDIIAISCTMTFHVPKVQNLIKTMKDMGIVTPIIVGGFPFNVDENLWKTVGADACSSDFEGAYAISEELTRGADYAKIK